MWPTTRFHLACRNFFLIFFFQPTNICKIYHVALTLKNLEPSHLTLINDWSAKTHVSHLQHNVVELIQERTEVLGWVLLLPNGLEDEHHGRAAVDGGTLGRRLSQGLCREEIQGIFLREKHRTRDGK